MNLNARWYNELKSYMDINVSGNSITGTYHNAAGVALGDYDFVGVIGPTPPQNGSQAVGWVVTWFRKSDGKDFGSITAWSGQVQVINGIETIVTTWLLTVDSDPADDWGSTNVGQDVFTKTPPSPEVMAARLARGSLPHPTRLRNKKT